MITGKNVRRRALRGQEELGKKNWKVDGERKGIRWKHKWNRRE
jgi:hypothetical protein